MEKNHGLLELLSTLILSTDGSIVKVNKNTLKDIQKSLQYAQVPRSELGSELGKRGVSVVSSSTGISIKRKFKVLGSFSCI